MCFLYITFYHSKVWFWWLFIIDAALLLFIWTHLWILHFQWLINIQGRGGEPVSAVTQVALSQDGRVLVLWTGGVFFLQNFTITRLSFIRYVKLYLWILFPLSCTNYQLYFILLLLNFPNTLVYICFNLNLKLINSLPNN